MGLQVNRGDSCDPVLVFARKPGLKYGLFPADRHIENQTDSENLKTILPRGTFLRSSGPAKAFRLVAAVFFAFALLGSSTAFSQTTYYSRQTGNWADGNTWTLTIGSGTAAGSFPNAGDFVTIMEGDVVTLTGNEACATLQLGATAAPGNFGTIQFSGAFTLTVSGNMAMGGTGNTARDGRIIFLAGSTVSAGSVTFGGANPNAGQAFLDMTAGGLLIVNGAITQGAGGGTWTPGAGEVQLTASSTLPGGPDFVSFNTLSIQGAGTTACILNHRRRSWRSGCR